MATDGVKLEGLVLELSNALKKLPWEVKRDMFRKMRGLLEGLAEHLLEEMQPELDERLAEEYAAGYAEGLKVGRTQGDLGGYDPDAPSPYLDIPRKPCDTKSVENEAARDDQFLD